MQFLFDTGASVSLIGLNTICGEESERCDLLRDIILAEINENQIEEYRELSRTVTGEAIHIYPCKCSGVSISGAEPIDFYFCLYLGNIEVPILGFDFITGCSFHHGIDGDIEVTAVTAEVGKKYYPEKLIDFNKIMRRYHG